MLTAEQGKALQDKFTKLVTDNQSAADKTAASNVADTAVTKAQSDAAAATAAATAAVVAAQATAAQAKIDEATADGTVQADLQDVDSYIKTLITPAPATP